MRAGARQRRRQGATNPTTAVGRLCGAARRALADGRRAAEPEPAPGSGGGGGGGSGAAGCRGRCGNEGKPGCRRPHASAPGSNNRAAARKRTLSGPPLRGNEMVASGRRASAAVSGATQTGATAAPHVGAAAAAVAPTGDAAASCARRALAKGQPAASAAAGAHVGSGSAPRGPCAARSASAKEATPANSGRPAPAPPGSTA